MGTFANSEDPDKMLHNATFYQGLHSLLLKTESIFRERNIFLEIIPCGPSIYRMDHPGFIVCSFMENSIGLKKVKQDLLAILFDYYFPKIWKEFFF